MIDRDIFIEALQKRDAAERSAFLDNACSAETRFRVEELLVRHERNGEFFLDAPLAIPATIDMPPVTEKPGTQIGPYNLREQIGEGGFGVVYVAQQSKPVRRKVALKIIKPGMDTKDVIARFEAERQALALMDHPNIAKVLDAGATDSGRPYFVMELVRGVPITEFCDEQKISTRERLQLFVDICRAIQHAHQKGVIHRDLKPSNIMVTLDDNRPIPKVIDFGIAKALTQQLTENSVYTAYGQMIGTPLYMAPEQAQLSMRDVDTRSDVYSLGVLLYELLTGTTPFDKETLQKSGFDEMRRIIREVEPPRPSARISTLRAEKLSTVSDQRKIDPRKLGASYRGELDWIVMKALEKDRNRRYESASAFAADVERYLADEPVQACPPSVWYRFSKFARRKKAALAYAALIALFVVTLGSGAGWVVRDRKARDDAAERERVALEEKAQSEREARRQQLADRVEFVLDEVAKYKKEQNWSLARQANSRAQALLEGSDGHRKLKDRVARHQKELDFISALQDVRANRGVASSLGDGKVKIAEKDDERYEKLFRDFGIDVEQLSVADAAARLKSHPDLLPVLATILDDWASSEALVRDSRKTAAKLWGLANAIDADRWRNNLRDALIRGDDDALKKLATSKDVLEQPPSTLWLLGVSLSGNKYGNEAIDRELGIKLLRKASHRHPRAFWLNYQAGVLLRRTGRAADAVRYLAVAHSIRPRVYGTRHDFAHALSQAGRHEEAIDKFQVLLRRSPKGFWWNYGIAFVYDRMGDYERALKHFQIAYKPGSNKAVIIQERIALQHLRLQQPDKAIPWLQKAIHGRLKEEADDPKANTTQNLANFHVNLLLAGTRAKVDVTPFLREVVEDHPKSAKARYALGLACQGVRFNFRDKALNWSATKDAKRLQEALAHHQKALELDPKFGAPWLAIGRLYQYGLKQPAKAIDAYHRAAELNYRPAECYRYAGLVHEIMQRRLPEAIDEYRKAVEVDKNYADGWSRLGLVLLKTGQYREAESALREAIRLKTDRVGRGVAYAWLGDVYFAQQRYVDAIVEYRQAMKLLPRTAPSVISSYGNALAKLGRYSQAVDACFRAFKQAPTNSYFGAQLADATVLEMRQSQTRRRPVKFQRLHAILKEAIKLQPDYFGFRHVRGVVFDAQSQHKQAIACWRKAVALKDDFAGTHYKLGKALIEDGQSADGVKHLREAVRLDSRNANFHVHLAIQLLNCADRRQRNVTEGLKAASQAVKLKPRDTLAWQALGWAKYRAKDWQGSIEALRKSMQLQAGGRGDAGQWVVLAMAYHQLGQTSLARKHYDNSVRWMKTKPGDEFGIARLMKEAAELLGIKVRPPVVAPQPKSQRTTGTPARR